MITDANLLLTSADAQVRAAGTYVGNNTLDLTVARDIGAGEGLKVLFNVEVAFAGGTTVTFQLITSAAAALTSPTVIGSSGAIATATLVVNYKFAMPIPELAPLSNGQRYFGVQAVGVGTYTAGTYSARIVKDADNVKYHASGYTVST